MRTRFVRAAVGDGRLADDQARAIRFGLGRGESRLDLLTVVTVDALNVPTVAFEAFLDVFGEGQAGVAFDGDVVVVVEVDQLA